MQLTMAHGTTAFSVKERPSGTYYQDDKGTLYIIQKVEQQPGGYKIMCRAATRIEQKLFQRDAAANAS